MQFRATSEPREGIRAGAGLFWHVNTLILKIFQVFEMNFLETKH